MEKFIREQRSAKPYQRTKILRTRLQDERPEKHPKSERWAKLSQKIEEDTVFKRLKDGRKHIRKSRCHDDTKSER
jgi:hypothetical protein